MEKLLSKDVFGDLEEEFRNDFSRCEHENSDSLGTVWGTACF